MADSAPRCDAEPELSADREVAGLFRRHDESRRLAAADAALGAADGRILWLLTNNGECTLRDISEKLSLEQSTVNRQVNAAVKEGFVQKRRSKTRGALVFSPSEEGRAAFDRDLERYLGLYRRGLDELDPADREVFTELLGRVVGGYEAAVRTAVWSRI